MNIEQLINILKKEMNEITGVPNIFYQANSGTTSSIMLNICIEKY